MVISRLIRTVFEVRGDCTSMQCFCWECWKIHQSALQSAVSVMAFVGGKLMQCHTNRGHCCLTAGIKHLFFVYVRIPGCCFVFSSPFPPFRLAEFDGFVWILIWASIYQCSVCIFCQQMQWLHTQSSFLHQLKLLHIMFFMRCKLKGSISSNCSRLSSKGSKLNLFYFQRAFFCKNM